MIEISLTLAIIMLIIFFISGFLAGRYSKKPEKRKGTMTVDELMGIASISWEVPYEEVVQADTIKLDVIHKDA